MEPLIRSLVPHSDDEIDPVRAVAAEDRTSPTGRPWVYTNMVTTLDGATAVGGVSGPLGGSADFAVFRALRASADAILVGARTVVEERYRPPQQAKDTAAVRTAAGRADRAEIAVVTRSLDLPLDLPMLEDPTYRPLILTVAEAPAERREALGERADVIDVGASDVDFDRALRVLGERGHRTVLCEGGPAINGQLIADDLIDEWNVSISPLLAAGDSRRTAVGAEVVGDPRRLHLARLWTGDDLLFGRWVRRH